MVLTPGSGSLCGTPFERCGVSERNLPQAHLPASTRFLDLERDISSRDSSSLASSVCNTLQVRHLYFCGKKAFHIGSLAIVLQDRGNWSVVGCNPRISAGARGTVERALHEPHQQTFSPLSGAEPSPQVVCLQRASDVRVLIDAAHYFV